MVEVKVQCLCRVVGGSRTKREGGGKDRQACVFIPGPQEMFQNERICEAECKMTLETKCEGGSAEGREGGLVRQDDSKRPQVTVEISDRDRNEGTIRRTKEKSTTVNTLVLDRGSDLRGSTLRRSNDDLIPLLHAEQVDGRYVPVPLTIGNGDGAGGAMEES